MQPSLRKQLELHVIFDALRGGSDAEALAEPNHRANDCQGVVASGELVHEGAVDLDLVEREAAQITQRRVASAEVVDPPPIPKS